MDSITHNHQIFIRNEYTNHRFKLRNMQFSALNKSAFDASMMKMHAAINSSHH